MHKAFPLPDIKFPLAEEVPTASVEGCHCQKKIPANTTDTTSGDKLGRTLTLTAEDMQRKKNDTFGGNEATKKTKKNLLKQQYGNFKAEGSETLEQTFNRLQVIIGQLQFMDVEIEQDDLNQKFLTSLAPEWLMYTIVWRNMSDLDTMSLDDLYNHLKVYESEVQKKLEQNSQNMAFTSLAKHNSRNEDVPTASTNVPTASASVATISQDTACAYIASQSSASKYLDNLIESQRSEKNKEGLGYTIVPPPTAQLYLSPKKDLSWTGLSECADDTVTDYSRPSPTIESISEDDQNRNPSDIVASPITSKPFIKFMKPKDSQSNSKIDRKETPKKPLVKAVPRTKLMIKGIGTVAALGCKITRKGTIKTECIVLRRDFKLLDDANILLKTPRQHNMYSINLNNIIPHKDLTCLVAEASADECMLWHRRLGKQHKASCKSKLVNSMSKPLHTLHMDLFGPTSVSSIIHKWYCLVVTDDFFRSPAIRFLKPFGYHVMILNTLDNLGKFEEKGDEGIKDAASQEVKKDVSFLRYIALPNWTHDALLEFSSSKPQDHCSTEVPEGSGNPNPNASTSNPLADQMETLTVETPIPTVSLPVPIAYSTDPQEPSSDARLISKRVASQEETPSLDNIISLSNRFEDILGVTSNSDESNGVEADISNMETAITASPTPTLRIHKDHP
uniref:Uncharacterized protein n=1 Tax=Tanacetum cinerariifolium TaxID=118510 RepID=A0A6L2JGX9_TANCI|nr:hypothetical protein [Tanacetum cinerariifolium]